jgi:hypothetical protein
MGARKFGFAWGASIPATVTRTRQPWKRNLETSAESYLRRVGSLPNRSDGRQDLSVTRGPPGACPKVNKSRAGQKARFVVPLFFAFARGLGSK